MFKKELNKLIDKSIKRKNKSPVLDNLEKDVWNKIHLAQKDVQLSWYEKIIQAMSIWQFQTAAIAFVCVMGLFIGINTSHKINSQYNKAMNLEVFSPYSPYLLSTKMTSKS